MVKHAEVNRLFPKHGGCARLICQGQIDIYMDSPPYSAHNINLDGFEAMVLKTQLDP